jgi:hypothetical protein
MAQLKSSDLAHSHQDQNYPRNHRRPANDRVQGYGPLPLRGRLERPHIQHLLPLRISNPLKCHYENSAYDQNDPHNNRCFHELYLLSYAFRAGVLALLSFLFFSQRAPSLGA